MAPPTRHLLTDVLPNLRDVGGLPTEEGRALRERRLLRTAALSPLPPATADRLTATLGPGVYVDLRTEPEVARDGVPAALLTRGWRWHRLAVRDRADDDHDDSPEGFQRRHLAALPRYLTVAREVAGLLGRRPVLVGCALGKDRTGLVVALLLRWLAVRRDAIVDDYAASTACLTRRRHLLGPHWQDPARTISPAVPRVCAAVLDAVDALGAAAPEAPADLQRLMLEEGSDVPT